MMLQTITIRDFGSVSLYSAVLTPSLNILDTRYAPEISAAIAFLLCSQAQQAIPTSWIRPTTQLSAEVRSHTAVYTVTATPGDSGFTLSVRDPAGTDVTDAYRHLLTHCPEQDAIESFDGRDKTLPLRLCWYRNCADAPENLSDRTKNLANTQTFRTHLNAYIKAFQPEPIRCKKAYLAALNPRGQFEAFCPGVSGGVSLSETEERLFLYICFLNLAEFWTDIEKIRDLHHEKKPLLLQNFLEYLDASTDIHGLLARTLRLQRQVILLTPPLSENTKSKWDGKDGLLGIFFKSGDELCSI